MKRIALSLVLAATAATVVAPNPVDAGINIGPDLGDTIVINIRNNIEITFHWRDTETGTEGYYTGAFPEDLVKAYKTEPAFETHLLEGALLAGRCQDPDFYPGWIQTGPLPGEAKFFDDFGSHISVTFLYDTGTDLDLFTAKLPHDLRGCDMGELEAWLVRTAVPVGQYLGDLPGGPGY